MSVMMEDQSQVSGNFRNYNAFKDPVYRNAFLKTYICAAQTDQITNTRCLDSTRCLPNEVNFRRPCIPEIRPYYQNMNMKHDDYKMTRVKMFLNERWYSSHKMDDEDADDWCNSAELRASYAESLGMIYALKQMDTTIAQMIKDAGCLTGNVKTKCGDLDLGTEENCVEVDKTDIHEYILRHKTAHSTICKTMMGEMFLLLPECAEAISLANDYFLDASKTGSCTSCSPLITGVHPNKVFGFNIIWTNSLKPIVVNGECCYPIISGFTDATCFKLKYDKHRITNPSDNWGSLEQTKMAWGHKVLEPNLIVIGFVKFQL